MSDLSQRADDLSKRLLLNGPRTKAIFAALRETRKEALVDAMNLAMEQAEHGHDPSLVIVYEIEKLMDAEEKQYGVQKES